MANKKYELTDVSIKHKGSTLYRIRALKDFGKVRKGDLGGWVESEYNLDENSDSWIYDEAKVFNKARILKNAKIFGKAEIFGNAFVADSEVTGNAKIYDNAEISKNAGIGGNAEIFGDALVSWGAVVYGNAAVYDDAKCIGRVEIFGHSEVCGDAVVQDGAKVYGSSRVKGNTVLKDKVQVFEDAYLDGKITASGNIKIHGEYNYEGIEPITIARDVSSPDDPINGPAGRPSRYVDLKIKFRGKVQDVELQGFSERADTVKLITVSADGAVGAFDHTDIGRIKESYRVSPRKTAEYSMVLHNGRHLHLRGFKDLRAKWSKADLAFKYKPGMDLDALVREALDKVE